MGRFKNWMAVAVVYLAWGAGVTAYGHWDELARSWFIAPTMLIGSLLAGATAQGGGAVAFPVLTLVFRVTPPVARDFSLMIQSVGMTAAAITIARSRMQVDWRAVRWAALGGFPGVILGLEVVSPLLTAAYTKMFFVAFWLAFAFVLYSINRTRRAHIYQQIPAFDARKASLLLAAGVIGGVVSGVTGSGLDITAFSLIVLGFQLDEAVATRSSVVMMAAGSCFAVLYRSLSGGGFAAEAWEYWWVAVPVVVIGAPLGAWLLRNQSRHLVTRVLYVSIISQFVTALVIIELSSALVWFTIAAWALGLGMFAAIARLGARLTPAEPEPR